MCNHQSPHSAVLLAKMLRGIIAQFPGSVPDPESEMQRPHPTVDKIVQERLSKWDLGMERHIYEKPFIVGYSIATASYHHVAPEVQAEIALYTGLVVLVDDGLLDAAAVREFVPRLCSGLPQLHPALGCLVEACHNLQQYFPTYGAHAIYSSTIDFVNAELFQQHAKAMDYNQSSAPYIQYIRDKDGLIPSYAAFVWTKDITSQTEEYIQAFPDTMEIVNIVNDIFSYYKEMKAGETRTFLVKLATANGREELEELTNLITRLSLLVERVRGILGKGKARDAWESFMEGSIRYYLQTPRYVLEEVLPELRLDS